MSRSTTRNCRTRGWTSDLGLGEQATTVSLAQRSFLIKCRSSSYAGVPVYEKEEDPRPALILWFFDSRSFVEGGQS